MDINVYFKEISSWLLSHGVRILLIIVLALFALKAAKLLSRRLFSVVQRRKDDTEFQKRTETLGSVIRHFLDVVIIIVATIMIIGEVEIAIGPVLTAAGVIGLSVGIGAQSLVKDIISGFFILLEDQIRVGDVIEIAGKDGVVEKINLRMTILRDLSAMSITSLTGKLTSLPTRPRIILVFYLKSALPIVRMLMRFSK